MNNDILMSIWKACAGENLTRNRISRICGCPVISASQGVRLLVEKRLLIEKTDGRYLYYTSEDVCFVAYYAEYGGFLTSERYGIRLDLVGSARIRYNHSFTFYDNLKILFGNAKTKAPENCAGACYVTDAKQDDINLTAVPPDTVTVRNAKTALIKMRKAYFEKKITAGA